MLPPPSHTLQSSTNERNFSIHTGTWKANGIRHQHTYKLLAVCHSFCAENFAANHIPNALGSNKFIAFIMPYLTAYQAIINISRTHNFFRLLPVDSTTFFTFFSLFFGFSGVNIIISAFVRHFRNKSRFPFNFLT